MNSFVVVLATNNSGKAYEIKTVLSGAPIRIMDLGQFSAIPEPAEDGETFEANALIKARYYAENTGYPALADDSGLVIEALGGRPGVHSARWAGAEASDEEKNARILAEMNGVADRRAAFICALALAAPTGEALTWLGRVDGEIALESIGSNGFGYDPIFYYPPFGGTFGQVPRDRKNGVSHRGRAVAAFVADLAKILSWLDKNR